MGQRIDQFCENLRQKLTMTDSGLDGLKAKIDGKAARVEQDVQSHLDRVQNRIEQGRAKVSAAQAEMEKTEERWWEAEIYRLQGTLLWRHSMAPPAEVETWFRRALDVARRQEARSLELRAATSLAGLWRHQDKHAEARDLLAPIYNWFTEGLDTPDRETHRGLGTEHRSRSSTAGIRPPRRCNVGT